VWQVEMYEDERGHCPVQRWLDSLSEQKFAAMDAAIRHRLAARGLDLAGTAWLKPLGDGLFEFRVRSSGGEIERMYSDAGKSAPAGTASILLRVFVHFHGQRAVLLLDGYDKGRDPSPRRQQQEIAAARKVLKAWKGRQARMRKHGRRR
jgi:putative component of toxin-antitoxin plasmid stabilization module